MEETVDESTPDLKQMNVWLHQLKDPQQVSTGQDKSNGKETKTNGANHEGKKTIKKDEIAKRSY